MAGVFDDLDLFQSIATQAMRRYDFPEEEEVELLVLSENATYLIFNPQTGSKDGVLRVGRPGYHTLEEYESEIAWLRQINDYTPLIVANPILAKDGSYIQQVSDGAGRSFTCIVTQFLEGEPPDENDAAAAVGQFKLLGETTAYLHRQTSIWNGTKDIKRWDWDFDNVIGKTAKWGRWQDFPGLTPQDESLLERCAVIIEKRLEKYGRNPDNFGLIHADLRVANLLIEGDQIKVIDFDDTGFGWYLQDLASAVSFIEHKPIVPELVNAWLDGYRKVLPFTDTDFVEIDTFLLLRHLQLQAWLASHFDSDPVKELSEGYLEGSLEMAERYLRLFG